MKREKFVIEIVLWLDHVEPVPVVQQSLQKVAQVHWSPAVVRRMTVNERTDEQSAQYPTTIFSGYAIITRCMALDRMGLVFTQDCVDICYSVSRPAYPGF